MEKQQVTFHLANSTIIKVVAVVIGLPLLYYLIDVFTLLFIAIILMSALAPLVDLFKRKLKVSTTAAILLSYLLSFLILGIIFAITIPPAIRQISYFISVLPLYIQNGLQTSGIVQDPAQLQEIRQNAYSFLNSSALQFLESIYNLSLGVISLLLAIITIGVFTFYLLMDKENVEGAAVGYVPFLNKDQRRDLAKLFKTIELKLGAWARGQFLLTLIIGVCTYVGLLLLQVEYALPLAVLAGILEIFPVIGPIISAIPAIIVVLGQDPIRVAFVVALYVLIQQLENHFVVPQVMKRAVGFSPVITIFAIMIGEKLMGIQGALLAVPFVATVFVIIDHYKNKNQ